MSKENGIRRYGVGARAATGSRGFTLIELMIVIIILAILVAIAIAVAFYARSNAQDSTAKSNFRTALKVADKWWMDHQLWRGAPAVQNYYFNTAAYSLYLSRTPATNQPTKESKIQWVYVTRTANNTLSLTGGRYRLGVLVAGTNGNATNRPIMYGHIGVYAGYRTTNTDGGAWTNSTAAAPAGNFPYYYTTVMVLNESNNDCYYASYRLGGLVCSGVFTWNANGTTNNFRAAPF